MISHFLRAVPKGILPTIVNTTYAQTTAAGAATATLNVPTHKANDLLFVIVTVNAVGFVTTIPSGWVEVGKTTAAAERLGVYYKLASGSEPASYNWVVAAQSALLSFSVRYATTYSIGAFATGAGSTSSLNAVTTYTNGRIIACAGIDNFGQATSVATTSNSKFTFPSGNIINGNTLTSGLIGNVAIAINAQATDGLTSGTSTVTMNSSQGLATVFLAVG